MRFRKSLVTAVAAGLLGVAATVSIGAHPNATHTMYVTFNRPVSLPGVTLARGTYIFEIPDATADHHLVRVSSNDRSIVYLTAFTSLVERPAGLKRSQVVSFTEAAPDRALPIAVWWPEDSQGREFIYPKK